MPRTVHLSAGLYPAAAHTDIPVPEFSITEPISKREQRFHRCVEISAGKTVLAALYGRAGRWGDGCSRAAPGRYSTESSWPGGRRDSRPPTECRLQRSRPRVPGNQTARMAEARFRCLFHSQRPSGKQQDHHIFTALVDRLKKPQLALPEASDRFSLLPLRSAADALPGSESPYPPLPPETRPPLKAPHHSGSPGPPAPSRRKASSP